MLLVYGRELVLRVQHISHCLHRLRICASILEKVVKNIGAYLTVNLMQDDDFSKSRISIVKYFDRSKEESEYLDSCIKYYSTLMRQEVNENDFKSDDFATSVNENDLKSEDLCTSDISSSNNQFSFVYGEPEVIKEQPRSRSIKSDYAISDFVEMREYCDDNPNFINGETN